MLVDVVSGPELDATATRAQGRAEAPLHVPAPEVVARSQMTAFARFWGVDTNELQRRSVEGFRDFWRAFLAWSALDFAGSPDPACTSDSVEHAVFFPRLELGWARSLLAGPVDAPALTARDESGRRVRWTRGELRSRVAAVSAALRARGVGSGDVVVAVARNDASAVVACLASAAIGATWASAAADLGLDALIDRFEPLAPRVLFACSRHDVQGCRRPIDAKIQSLRARLPTIEHAIGLDDGVAITLDALAVEGRGAPEDFPLFPFAHPLFVVFSSGTTGRPKAIVHGAGGTLLEHHKEHRLHVDLGPRDKVFFQTTCGWMMWNWLLSALATGAEIVLYDGSPTFPEPDALLRLVAEERVTVFGTSPAYLQIAHDAGLLPARHLDLSSLRAILSTGSILPERLHRWLRDVVPAPVCSISGGTDILGCFFLGDPNRPVWAGELQTTSLGLDAIALRADGSPCAAGEIGELVCRKPFPSRPLGLVGDPTGARFHEAYFAANDGVWTHGDLVEPTAHGGVRMHGRSDGVVNVRGIRIGPAEFSRALDGVDEVVEAMPIEQDAPREAGGSRLVLLVVLRSGAALDDALVAKIKRVLLERASPAHVPSVVADVTELPTTHNGKRSERAARDAANGRETTNAASLRNPESLRAIAEHPRVRAERAVVQTKARPGRTTWRRHDVEEELRRIWEATLGVPSIGLDDDYFDLGGDSLAALELLVAVEASFGRRLPMASLLSAGSTVRGMARIVLGELALDASSSIVLIQRGDPERMPVWWVPGGGGLTVFAFRELSRELGDAQPVYGLAAPSERAVSSVEDLAARHVVTLRAARPRGPYALLGFSYGAWVAYEMAVALRRLGEAVPLVVLFDSALPMHLSLAARARTFAARASYYGRLALADPARFGTSLHEAARNRLPARSRGRSSIFVETDRANRAAIERYIRGDLPRFDGKITVVLAERTWRSHLPPELDGRLAVADHAARVEVFRVGGSHLSMLRRPEATELAGVLRACIDASTASIRG